jgi:hypothetical protein
MREPERQVVDRALQSLLEGFAVTGWAIAACLIVGFVAGALTP